MRFVLAEASTIVKHGELNPALWVGDRLMADVRQALLRFGKAWQEFAKIPDSAVRDVLLVGGNASYFYNSSSDLDVHVLIDKASLGYGPVVDDFLMDRKALWTMKHHPTVRGYTLEPYAQDVKDPLAAGQGVYSLRSDKWVQRPVQTDYDPASDATLARKVDSWEHTIRKALKHGEPATLEKLRDKLKAMRQAGIRAGGELNRDNLAFKELRNRGVLDRLSDALGRAEDEELSL